MSKRTFLSAASAAAALVVVGCGGASYGSGPGNQSSAGKASHAPAASAPAAAGAASLRVITDPKLGRIIADANGRTLYDFVIDKGTASVCYGACASLWPPYTTNGRPVAGKGVLPKLIGTTKRRDGSLEVTYAGRPLYYYAPDRARGQITGQALNQFGAPWYALAPAGTEIHIPGM
jgi:predicted lipoprotein with Yx(FWY)xxD motif